MYTYKTRELSGVTKELMANSAEGCDEGGEDCRVKILWDRFFGGSAGRLACLSSAL